jgi:triosephosphate isomerase
MIFVNFKTYSQGGGEKAVGLAKVCQEVAEERKISVVPLVQAFDIFRISQEVKIPLWLQHLDWHPQGQYTGWLNLEGALEAGAGGTILNHSEHKLPFGTIRQTIKRIKKTNPQFQVLVCCRSLGQAEKLVKLKPDFLAYEPPELIGGEVSVSEYNPTAIAHFVEICGETPAIIGAGIKNKNDVKIGVKLGARGILVSSHVVLAENPKKVLENLVEGFL